MIACDLEAPAVEETAWTHNGVTLTPEPFTGVWVKTREEAERVRGLRINGQRVVIYLRDKFFPGVRACYGPRSFWRERYNRRTETWRESSDERKEQTR